MEKLSLPITQIVDLEYQVFKLAMMLGEIHYNSEGKVANNMDLSENNDESSKEIYYAKTNIETVGAEIAYVDSNKYYLQKKANCLSVR